MKRELAENQLVGAHYGDTMRAIVQFLRDNPGEHHIREIIVALDLRGNVGYAYISRLVDAGWVARPRRAMYRAHNIDRPFFMPNRPGWGHCCDVH